MHLHYFYILKKTYFTHINRIVFCVDFKELAIPIGRLSIIFFLIKYILDTDSRH